jgi:predicted transcriptional regulator
MFDLPPLESLVEAVKSLKLSQRRLAHLAGISQPTLSKMMRGSEVRYSTVRRVAEAVGRAMGEGKPSRSVGEICSRKLTSVKPTDPLRKALNLMLENSYDQLPVFDGKQVVGTVLQSDIVGALNVASVDELLQRPVREVMSRSLPIVDERETVEVVKLLLLHRQAILVRIGGRIDAIVTWPDILKL